MAATPTTIEVIERWRAIGPGAWAESEFGWIGQNGQPVKLAPWQRAVLDAWQERRGECTTLAVSNCKKSGKTFLNAIITAWRWLVIPGQHFTIGNDLDQSTARQFTEISEMVRRHPYLSGLVKVQQSLLRFEATGATLQALAADASGNAGANHMTASHTEAWGIIHEGAVRAYEELTPPPSEYDGLPAMRVLDSYAGFEGESKTWHGIVDRGLRGERISQDWPIYQAGGLILFHMTGEEARQRCFRGTERQRKIYYTDQAEELRPAAFTRMHGNERTAGESAFIDPGAWALCLGDVRPLAVGDKRKAVFAADASTSNDLTALVGCVYDAKSGLVDVVYTRVWKPVKIAGIRLGRATVDIEETIEAEVLDLYDRGQVAAVACDPYQLHSSILRWQKAGIRVIEMPQTSARVESDMALYQAINSRTLRHFGDPELTEHVKNAVAVETARGFRLAKEKASKKIDLAVALSMAAWASRQSRYAAPEYSWQPDPWSDDVTEDTYNRWEIEHGEIYPGGRPEGMQNDWSRKPHPAGVTWQNCTKRARGCYACVAEMRAAGVYDQDAEEAKIRAENARDRATEAAQSLPIFPDPAAQEYENHRRRFWRAVELRKNNPKAQPEGQETHERI